MANAMAAARIIMGVTDAKEISWKIATGEAATRPIIPA